MNPLALIAAIALGAGAWYFLGQPKTERREGVLFVKDDQRATVMRALGMLRVIKAESTLVGAAGSAVAAVQYTLVPAAQLTTVMADPILGKTGVDAARAAYSAGLFPVGPLSMLLDGQPGVMRAVDLGSARALTTDASKSAVAPASILT